MAPITARGIFCGKIAPIPTSLKTSCKKRVIKILEDAIVDVREAPILLRPITYNNAASRGTKENKIRYTQFSILKCGIEVVDIIPAKIKPEINNEAPDTSRGLWVSTSFVIIITPAPKAKAETIASKSPKVSETGIAELKFNEPLDTAEKNPINVIMTPTS